MKIGLYFGTFNPIHIGHLAIANYMLEFAGIDQLWFVVSPQSPFKQKQNMLDDYQRLELVNRAIGDDLRMRVSSIEFKLPKPSYTIDTLTYLQEEFPAHRFSILMGSDNLENFHKWKNYEQIIENYPVIIYPRPGFDPLTVEVHKDIGNIYPRSHQSRERRPPFCSCQSLAVHRRNALLYEIVEKHKLCVRTGITLLSLPADFFMQVSGFFGQDNLPIYTPFNEVKVQLAKCLKIRYCK